MWLYLARRSLSASYGPRNRTVSHSRTIFILSSRRCSSFHDYYLAERRRDDKRFVETVSLSFSRGIVLAETRPLYRGQSDFEWPQVHTSLDPSIVWLFFFFGRKPDQNPDVESIDSLAVAIYRVINLSGRIYLVENICNASLFDDRVDPRKRKRFFFLIWRLLGSNIESISDSFTGSIPLLRFIEAWLIHRMNSSSLTFMLIAGNARDFCRCVSLSFR